MRLVRLCFAIVVLASVAPTASRAQAPAASNISASPSACWRFAFGQWTPALDWSKAGHPGEIGATASAVQRIRDSVFARDPVATNNNAMTWERTPDGMLLMLYPPWWPVGVKVTFDSTTADGTEMVGTAVALQANADQTPSHSRALARQVACSSRNP